MPLNIESVSYLNLPVDTDTVETCRSRLGLDSGSIDWDRPSIAVEEPVQLHIVVHIDPERTARRRPDSRAPVEQHIRSTVVVA